jgi:protein-tyrosine phosphatase
MPKTVYWISRRANGRLGIVARPRGADWLDHDVRLIRACGVDILVSALTATEVDELGLSNEASCCANAEISFIPFPIEDRGIPASGNAVKGLATHLRQELDLGHNVAIHCRAGIGRSSLLAACILVSEGVSSAQAFQALAQARGCEVPDTPQQRSWVDEFSKQLKS